MHSYLRRFDWRRQRVHPSRQVASDSCADQPVMPNQPSPGRDCLRRPRRLATPVLASLLSLLVTSVLISCSSRSTSPASAGNEGSGADTAPAGLPSFYSVPSRLHPASPGTLVGYQRVDTPALHAATYRVMYHSRSVTGKDVIVTGLVAVPQTSPPTAGYPVISWGHGTDGQADSCAPSLRPDDFGDLGASQANFLLDRGYELTATDYEGLGTPGRPPYLVGVSEARGTIDIVRAARHIPLAHASDRYLVWGHSEGGQAALFALHIAGQWAPELHLVGVVAGAPPSQLTLLYQAVKASPFKYHILMVIAGFNAAYGDKAAPLDQVLTAAGQKALGVLDTTCQLYAATQALNFAALTRSDPATVPAWRSLLDANDAGRFTTPAPIPLLIIQGSDDQEIPAVSTQLLFSQLCSKGQVSQRWLYLGQSHTGVLAASLADMTTWMAHRFAGLPAPDPMTPRDVSPLAPSRGHAPTGPTNATSVRTSSSPSSPAAPVTTTSCPT